MRDKLLLDEALAHLREVGHNHTADELTRKHIEYAAAHIRQAWIAADGQRADDPAVTHKNVTAFYRLESLAASKARP